MSSFEGKALRNRAFEKHESGTPLWLEAEAAKLIFRIVIEDFKGERSLVNAVVGDWGFEDEIVKRAKARVPFWIADLPAS